MQSEVVSQVLALAHQAVKETHRDRLEAYIRAYCRAIPPEVLDEVDVLDEDVGGTVSQVSRSTSSLTQIAGSLPQGSTQSQCEALLPCRLRGLPSKKKHSATVAVNGTAQPATSMKRESAIST